MSEVSIAAARVSVMLYDDVNKKWIPSGGTTGLSKVHIYQHQVNGTFRVVGRRLQDTEVVLNCAIIKGMKYNQSTPTFHQWRDNKQVYGLNFSSKDDADAFANAMQHAVTVLSSNTSNRAPVINMLNQNLPVIPQPVYQIPNGQPSDLEDMGYRTLTREDIAQIQERRPSQTHAAVTPVAIENNGAPPVPGHHRTNSAPPPPTQHNHIPLAPPLPPSEPTYLSSGPPPPPLPPSCGPPPPPMPNGVIPRSVSDNDGRGEPGSLAAALQQAKLKRSSKDGLPGCEGTTNGMYGTLGRQGSVGGGERPAIGGMASMMDEMAKTLARRRAQQEKKEESVDICDAGDKKNSEQKSSCKGSESPKPGRKRIGSDDGGQPKVNGVAENYDLETFKQEMLKEMRKELNKIKLEIIDAMRLELSRR